MSVPVKHSEQTDLAPNVENLYLETYAFTTAAAIVGSVDRKIFVLLRDGRNLFGILRTFDQFANLVLQDTIERIYLPENSESYEEHSHPSKYGEAYRGVFMIRGENVVMLGELDIDKEDEHLENLREINFEEAEREHKTIIEKRIQEQKMKTKALQKKGHVGDFFKSDMY